VKAAKSSELYLSNFDSGFVSPLPSFEFCWESFAVFFGTVICWFLQGIFTKMVFLWWCFCGEFVVECVANVVEKPRVFAWLKTGHHFEVYFWSDRLPLTTTVLPRRK
jgi:hypothetical protein